MQHAAILPALTSLGKDAAAWIDEGNRAFNRQAFADARIAFRAAHSLHNTPLSSYSLGLVAEAEGQPDEAITCYAAAVAADPLFVPARVNLAQLLRRRDRLDETMHHMLVAHALAPNHPLPINGLAEAAMTAGRPDLAVILTGRLVETSDAAPLRGALNARIARGPAKPAPAPDITAVVDNVSIDTLDRLAALDPGDAGVWTDLGNALLADGAVLDAVALQHQAVLIDPLGLAPLNNLAVALRAAGRPLDAVRPLLTALALKPDWTAAWANLGRAYLDLGAGEAAWDAWHLACPSQSEDVDHLSVLAETSRRLGRRAHALATIDRIAALRPGDYMVPNNRGAYLLDAGAAEAALDCFREAARLNPQASLPLSNCGAAAELLGRYGEARDYYAQALDLGGETAALRARLIHVSQHLCAWKGFDRQCRDLREDLRTGDGAGVQPFSLLAVPGIGPDDMRQAAERHAGHYAEIAVVAAKRRDPSRRPRIGYLSSDLYGHATAWLIAEILEQHDSAAFDIHIYSYGQAPEDETRARLRAACPRFVDIDALSDADAAARIRADGIDILVDLKGYTRGARPQILAFRPAPVQVNYLGFPGTMGASFIDYIIADETIVPAALEHFYSEKVVRLPHCYQPNDRRRPLPPRPSRASVGLPEGALVLCSFNAAYKLTPDMFDLWCQLLHAVPDSVLWLLSSEAATNDNLRREAELRGVSPERLIFAPRTDLAGHMARFRCADLFLDSFPCTAHTTASDALWAGVPVVTRTGDTFASRVAASVVAAAGLPQLVAATADEYFETALDLATDRNLLERCKAHLEAVRFTCPLFDSAAYTRDLEQAFTRMLEAGR